MKKYLSRSPERTYQQKLMNAKMEQRKQELEDQEMLLALDTKKSDQRKQTFKMQKGQRTLAHIFMSMCFAGFVIWFFRCVSAGHIVEVFDEFLLYAMLPCAVIQLLMISCVNYEFNRHQQLGIFGVLSVLGFLAFVGWIFVQFLYFQSDYFGLKYEKVYNCKIENTVSNNHLDWKSFEEYKALQISYQIDSKSEQTYTDGYGCMSDKHDAQLASNPMPYLYYEKDRVISMLKNPSTGEYKYTKFILDDDYEVKLPSWSCLSIREKKKEFSECFLVNLEQFEGKKQILFSMPIYFHKSAFLVYFCLLFIPSCLCFPQFFICWIAQSQFFQKHVYIRKQKVSVQLLNQRKKIVYETRKKAIINKKVIRKYLSKMYNTDSKYIYVQNTKNSAFQNPDLANENENYDVVYPEIRMKDEKQNLTHCSVYFMNKNVRMIHSLYFLSQNLPYTHREKWEFQGAEEMISKFLVSGYRQEEEKQLIK